MVHLDASQTIGKHPLCLKKHPIDFVSLSAHKCYGPQGIGALYIKNGRHIQPLIHGHNKVRSGTMSHTLIQLMGEAYQHAYHDFTKNINHISQCRELFLANIPQDQMIYNQQNNAVPHIVNITFPNASIGDIDTIRQHIYCQQSSACFAGGLSHVLKARHLTSDHIQRSIRFSFGITTTQSDIANSTALITKILLNE
jgi:cysteine desulfurase